MEVTVALLLVFFSAALLVYALLGHARVPPATELKADFKARVTALAGTRSLTGYRELARRRLAAAGLPPEALETFLSLQVLCAAGGSLLGFLAVLTPVVGLAFILLVPGIGIAAGLLLPWWGLSHLAARRRLAIRRALPAFLDLFTVAVEAGLDFSAALSRLTEKAPPGPLKDELIQLLRQIRLGHVRREALRDLAWRVDLPEMTAFATVLIQADQLGTSIGPTLRIQADEARTRRLQHAEKLAMQAPVKMLLPLLGCIFPAVFILLFLPIALRLSEVLR